MSTDLSCYQVKLKCTAAEQRTFNIGGKFYDLAPGDEVVVFGTPGAVLSGGKLGWARYNRSWSALSHYLLSGDLHVVEAYQPTLKQSVPDAVPLNATMVVNNAQPGIATPCSGVLLPTPVIEMDARHSATLWLEPGEPGLVQDALVSKWADVNSFASFGFGADGRNCASFESGKFVLGGFSYQPNSLNGLPALRSDGVDDNFASGPLISLQFGSIPPLQHGNNRPFVRPASFTVHLLVSNVYAPAVNDVPLFGSLLRFTDSIYSGGGEAQLAEWAVRINTDRELTLSIWPNADITEPTIDSAPSAPIGLAPSMLTVTYSPAPTPILRLFVNGTLATSLTGTLIPLAAPAQPHWYLVLGGVFDILNSVDPAPIVMLTVPVDFHALTAYPQDFTADPETLKQSAELIAVPWGVSGVLGDFTV